MRHALIGKYHALHITHVTSHPFLKQQTIKDAHLFGLLGVLVLLDIIFLTLWTIFHPLHLLERSVSVEVSIFLCHFYYVSFYYKCIKSINFHSDYMYLVYE